MAINHYDWSQGPDAIQQHSIAKHRILQSYLAAYFQTLVSSPHQDCLRLTLVDGFAGGGLYYHTDTKELVRGSDLPDFFGPFIPGKRLPGGWLKNTAA